jgi:hypothetical protein
MYRHALIKFQIWSFTRILLMDIAIFLVHRQTDRLANRGSYIFFAMPKVLTLNITNKTTKKKKKIRVTFNIATLIIAKLFKKFLTHKETEISLVLSKEQVSIYSPKFHESSPHTKPPNSLKSITSVKRFAYCQKSSVGRTFYLYVFAIQHSKSHHIIGRFTITPELLH